VYREGQYLKFPVLFKSVGEEQKKNSEKTGIFTQKRFSNFEKINFGFWCNLQCNLGLSIFRSFRCLRSRHFFFVDILYFYISTIDILLCRRFDRTPKISNFVGSVLSDKIMF